MTTYRRYLFLVVFIAIPIITGIACNIPLIQVSATVEPTTGSIATQPVKEKLVIIEDTVDPIEPVEPFHLVVTEAQLASIINYELASYQEYKIEDVEVFLRDGKLKITGTVEQNNLLLPLTVEVLFNVNENGSPEYEIIAANVGPFELPDFLVDQLNVVIDNALESITQQSANNIHIESITIEDGQAAISGYAK